MKSTLRLILALCVLGLSRPFTHAAEPISGDSGSRLTIDLRDGSRVVGQNVDDQFKFRSPLLGDLKLKVNDLRSIDSLTTNTAKVTTVNGDVLTVGFVNSDLRIKTSFGKVELAVNSIRHLSVTPPRRSGQALDGLIALWSGEGDGNDSVGNHDAKLTDISFTDGKVGQAFSFNGYSSYFNIPDSPALDVGTGAGFTVSAWIKPTKVNGIYNLIEWNDYLCAFEIGMNPSDQGVIVASVYDSDRNNHFLRSASRTIVANVFQHLALTYDQASGFGTLYVNGNIVACSKLGSLIPLTKGGLRIGYRPSSPGDSTYNRFYVGLLDELAIYNRALSASEIQDICTEQNDGKSMPPPPTGPSAIPYNSRFKSGFAE